MSIDLDAFEAWLRAQEYAESTTSKTVRDAQQLVAWLDEDRALPARLRPIALRIRTYAELSGDDALLRAPPFQALVAPQDMSPRAKRLRRQRKGRRVTRSMGDEDWARFHQTVREDPSPEARVLHLMADTSLRIGDVLRLTRSRLSMGLRTGRVMVIVKGNKELIIPTDGADEAWMRLDQAWRGSAAPTVAAWLAPNGSGDATSRGGAYTRVARKLKKLAEDLDIAGRVHLHRLRRTVGVQALRVTGDVPAVQQLLGHSSINTTHGYLDEARPDAVADVQQQVRNRFTEPEE